MEFSIPVKINIIDTFNLIIDALNRLPETVDKQMRDLIDDLDEEDTFELSRELLVVDIKFKIICGHLEKLAERAVVLGDKEILECLERLGIIKAEETQDEESKPVLAGGSGDTKPSH